MKFKSILTSMAAVLVTVAAQAQLSSPIGNGSVPMGTGAGYHSPNSPFAVACRVGLRLLEHAMRRGTATGDSTSSFGRTCFGRAKKHASAPQRSAAMFRVRTRRAGVFGRGCGP